MKQNQQFTIGLVIAAVILGGYMYFVESKKEAPTDTKDVEIWSMSDAKAKDITPVVITANGKTETYNRSGDDWKLASQPTRTVEKSGFENAFNNLKNLTATRKVEDKPSDLGKYGLKSPAVVVRWGDENTKFKIEVGDKTPTGDAYYSHVIKDDGIYTIAAYKVESWRGLVTTPPLQALPSPSPSPSPAAAGAKGASGAAATTSTAPAASTKPAASAAPAKTGAVATAAPKVAVSSLPGRTVPSPVATKAPATVAPSPAAKK